MNTSEKTMIIAQGIAFYAALQNLPSNRTAGTQEEMNWYGWCAKVKNASWESFVKQEQHRLFDVVNSRL